MRRPQLRNALIFRSKCAHVVRNYLDQHGFVEIETPVLSKSTLRKGRGFSGSQPGVSGNFALPQSPQLYKALHDRRTGPLLPDREMFRDEDQRADRQPELPQIDVEMSFITPEDIYQIMEGLMVAIWKETLGVELSAPFPRMDYYEAMERFGSDKPDVRFGMELKDVTDIGKECEFNVFKTVAGSGAKLPESA